MVLIKAWRVLTGLVASTILLALLSWSLLNIIKIDASSTEVSRLFLQLERAIGYDGFIHNFKNSIIRPNETAYIEAALKDYQQVESTLADIDTLVKLLEIDTDLGPLNDTMQSYREMLDVALVAKQDGLSVSEVDRIVRISDIPASASIQQFQARIEAILEAKHRNFSILLGLTIATICLAIATLAWFQHLKRREAERYSAELTEKSKFILQAERIAKLGRWTMEPNGSISLSDAAMDICGVTPENLTQSADFFSSIVPPVDFSKLKFAMNKAIDSQGEFICVHRVERPDGTTITVVNSGETIVGPEGDIIGFVGVLQDTTHLADIEDKLRQSQKMEAIGNLAGGMAHDFNNILAVILGNLELMEDNKDASKQEGYIKSALGAAQNGADLTRKMLSFARRAPLNPELIHVNDMVRSVIAWAERLLPANIRVETSLLKNLWHIETDKNLVQNALLNLMLNARDAMKEGGTLTIETYNVRIDELYIDARDEDLIPGRYVLLAVSDTGKGIDNLTLTRIFEPFFSTKAAGAGSGLGLPMVLGFMKQSNGAVRAYSEVGVGTTFKLYFRASDQKSESFRPAHRSVSMADFKGSRVLLAEDDQKLRETLEELMTLEGLSVTSAESGDEAFAIWSADPTFELVVTDIVMPGRLQGTHLAKEIRKDRVHSPQFIFLSGYANEATVNGNGLQPEDKRLMKPVNRKDLIETIATSLQFSRDTKEHL